MIAPTHITFAEFLYLLILTTTGIALTPINAIVVGIASLMPDVDTQASTIGKLFPFISKRIERRFGHRTLTHSALFIVTMAIALSPLLIVDFTHRSPDLQGAGGLDLNLNLNLSRDLYFSFLLGYASHPFLDTMTINGVQLFYPFSRYRCVFPLEVNQPQRYRMRTGSKLDKGLAVIFLLACIPVWFIANEGHKRIIRVAQQSIESAVRDFNELSRTHRVVADFAAHNLLTRQTVEGTFEIVGSLNDHTLLFRGSDSLLHSIGKEYHAEYVAERIICRRGAAVHTLIETIDMNNRPLSQIELYLAQNAEHQLFGTITTDTPVMLDPLEDGFISIRGTSRTLHFNHASYNDIRRLGLGQLFVTRGSLVLRSITTDSVAGGGIRDATEFIRTSIEIASSDSVQVVCTEGERVLPGKVLVQCSDIGMSERRGGILTRQQLELLKHNTRMNESANREQQILVQIRQDSLAVIQLETMKSSGFISQEAMASSIKKLNQTRSRLAALLEKRKAAEQSHALAMRKHAQQLEGLSEKQKEPLRSPVSGIIHEIRQHINKHKRVITITLRKQ